MTVLYVVSFPESIIHSVITEIIKTAKAKASDIIIMGTHGRTGLMNIVMGSVPEKIVRYSPFPVLTIKNKGYKYFPKPDYEYDTHPTY